MKLLKKSGAILLALSMLCVPTMAHGGRTDGSGGHRDNKNKSGLGYYHYHCGGYPAHLHSGGVCPYAGTPKSSSSSSKSSSSSSTATKSTSKSTAPKYNEKSVKFVIDGNSTTIKGIEVNNTNLVELKTLCEKLGISINYDSVNKTITGGKANKSFKLTIGNKGATVNGSYVTMSVAPITYNGRTMVPARVIAEAIGKAVTYDESTNTIHIGSTVASVPTSTTYAREDEELVYFNDVAEAELIDRTAFRDVEIVVDNDYTSSRLDLDGIA